MVQNYYGVVNAQSYVFHIRIQQWKKSIFNIYCNYYCFSCDLKYFPSSLRHHSRIPGWLDSTVDTQSPSATETWLYGARDSTHAAVRKRLGWPAVKSLFLQRRGRRRRRRWPEATPPPLLTECCGDGSQHQPEPHSCMRTPPPAAIRAGLACENIWAGARGCGQTGTWRDGSPASGLLLHTSLSGRFFFDYQKDDRETSMKEFLNFGPGQTTTRGQYSAY